VVQVRAHEVWACLLQKARSQLGNRDLERIQEPVSCRIKDWVRQELDEPTELECPEKPDESVDGHELCKTHAFAVRAFARSWEPATLPA